LSYTRILFEDDLFGKPVLAFSGSCSQVHLTRRGGSLNRPRLRPQTSSSYGD